MIFDKYRENYVPTIENRLREIRSAKIKAIAFWLACAAGFIAVVIDLYVR